MRKFFYNIGQALSLFPDENSQHQDDVTNNSENSTINLHSIIEKKSDSSSSSLNNDENVQEKIRKIILQDLQNNSVIDQVNLNKAIKEHLQRRRIHNVDSANTTEAILALLREIQVQLQSIINTSNFITYEEQYTEVLFSNLTSELYESFVSSQGPLIEEPMKTPLGVVCQIKGKHRRISVPDKDVDQRETSAKGERHIRDEDYFEEFLKEIQEGLNRGFYQKRRRYWSRFSFGPSNTASERPDFVVNQSPNIESPNSLQESSQLLSLASASPEILNKNEPSLHSRAKETEIFPDCVTMKKEKFPAPATKDSQPEDENNPFKNTATFLSPTSSVNQKLSLESNRISKIPDDSPSRSVESTSNASSLSLSGFQLDETKQNDSEQKIINPNLQSDTELSREISILEEQNDNNNNNKSEDAESAAGPNLIIADESVLKLARALNIAKRFQNENKVLWQQITRLKCLINEKDLEIKRVKLHSKKEASQDEVKILKDKLTFLEQEQSIMSQNLRKSEKLCREYERDLDGLEKNLEFAEQRRKNFKTNCPCKSESSRQSVNFGAVPEKDNEDQESENENQEDGVEGSSIWHLKGNKTENSSTEKVDNSPSPKRFMSHEKTRSGHTLRNSRLRKEFKNNKSER